MTEIIGKITLGVRGESFEATIEPITAHAADSRLPWLKQDELHVWLSFEQGEGKHPGSTLSFGLTFPVRDYKPDELLALIKKESERVLESIQMKADDDHAYRQAKDTRQKELDELASQLTNAMKEESDGQ